MIQTALENQRIGVISIRKGGGYAVLLSLLPVIMMYKVPVVNMGLATVLIAVSLAYAAAVIITNLNRIRFSYIIPIYLYAIWNIIRSDGDMQSILLCVAIMVHVTAISTGVVDSYTLKKTTVMVSCAAAVWVILQQLLYRLTSFRLPGLITELMLNNLKGYGYKNFLGSDGYRPGGFFMEPSHFAQYCFVGIAIVLMDKEMKSIKKAMLISLGILCTTSGMGIGLVAALWGFYFFTRLQSVGFSGKVKRICTYTLLVCVVLLIALQIPTIQFTLSRIFAKDTTGYNAIDGRFFFWDSYFLNLSTDQLIWGLGASQLPDDAYFTGLMEILYCYGYVGIVLFYAVLAFFFWKGNSVIRAVALMLGVLIVIANIAGFISLIFYFGTLITILLIGKNCRK